MCYLGTSLSFDFYDVYISQEIKFEPAVVCEVVDANVSFKDNQV
jgi:hypothetical protein